MQLSHKDLVKLGRYESSRGYSLNKVEADFLKKGIKKEDAIKALKEIEYYKKREALKVQRETEAKKLKNKETASKTTTEKKPSFWLWLILLVLIGILFYLYFSGAINFDFLS